MIKYHKDLEQGTDEWHKLRLGIMTASNLKHLFTGKLAISKANEVKTLAFELAAQRKMNHVDETFQSYHMERGHIEEVIARDIYSEKIAQVTECGFITSDKLGYRIGYSPDGLVGEDGLIEIKSVIQKNQIKTIVGGEMPLEYMCQCQTGLLVTGRKWIDFISYSNGMPMFVKRILPDLILQSLIMQALTDFELSVIAIQKKFKENSAELIKTERVEHFHDDEISPTGA